MGELRNVDACELVSKVLRVSEELASRPTNEFDDMDVQRLLLAVENLVVAAAKAHFSQLPKEEKAVILQC